MKIKVKIKERAGGYIVDFYAGVQTFTLWGVWDEEDAKWMAKIIRRFFKENN